MSALQESIYFASPVIIQNILVSLYGLKLYRERYGKNSDRYLEELRRTEKFTDVQMKEYQDREFVRLARHAVETVPYYRELARKNGFGTQDINSLEDIKLFPVLDKDDIRVDPKRFLSDEYRDKPGVFTLSTSGTSGKPLVLYCDKESRTRHYAFFRRLRGWYGLDDKSRRATMFGRIILKPDHQNPPFWRYDLPQRNLLMSSYHLTPKNLCFYYNKLQKYNPDEIIAYPSSIYQLAKYILEEGLPPMRPKVVFTTAETLLEYQREALEKAFDCPVVDQYGCTEMAFFASQCGAGSMHLHPEHGVVEVMNEKGDIISDAEPGILLATGFVNYAMPLIRYKVGDIVGMSSRKCQCERAFPVIGQLEGRVDDILVTPSGRPLGRLDPIFKGRSGISETQIIQHAPDQIEFKIVADKSFNEKMQKELLYEIEKRIGEGVQIVLSYVDSIPKDRNGKFKSVIRGFKSDEK